MLSRLLEAHETIITKVRALLIGGLPFDEEILMWWNFVARTRAEITEAYQDWDAAEAGTDRFGPVASSLPRIPVSAPPWSGGSAS
jgi:redox-sensitive bicupin YhaK (pirin superfamily)